VSGRGRAVNDLREYLEASFSFLSSYTAPRSSARLHIMSRPPELSSAHQVLGRRHPGTAQPAAFRHLSSLALSQPSGHEPSTRLLSNPAHSQPLNPAGTRQPSSQTHQSLDHRHLTAGTGQQDQSSAASTIQISP